MVMGEFTDPVLVRVLWLACCTGDRCQFSTILYDLKSIEHSWGGPSIVGQWADNVKKSEHFMLLLPVSCYPSVVHELENHLTVDLRLTSFCGYLQ